jgi:hypothetical protein
MVSTHCVLSVFPGTTSASSPQNINRPVLGIDLQVAIMATFAKNCQSCGLGPEIHQIERYKGTLVDVYIIRKLALTLRRESFPRSSSFSSPQCPQVRDILLPQLQVLPLPQRKPITKRQWRSLKARMDQDFKRRR